jgi:hypothetical protein
MKRNWISVIIIATFVATLSTSKSSAQKQTTNSYCTRAKPYGAHGSPAVQRRSRNWCRLKPL